MSAFDSTEHRNMRKKKQQLRENVLNKDMDYKNINHAQSITIKI